MITINNLHKSYGKNEVLRGIDLSFDRAGTITAVLGPNGSGKTTLIKSILGMVIPTSGTIEVKGRNVAGQWAYRSLIDYLPQIARFPDNLRVRELIDMIRDIRPGASRDEQLIDRFGLGPYLDSSLGNLSGGTKQKVNLTLALMYDSPVLILDEPTSGLDPVAMLELKDLIRSEKEQGKTIIITTHIMNFVEEMADDIVFLLDGQIHFEGSLSQLREKYNEPDIERAIARILQGKPPVMMNGRAPKLRRLKLARFYTRMQ